jgi:hypothetical protein
MAIPSEFRFIPQARRRSLPVALTALAGITALAALTALTALAALDLAMRSTASEKLENR